MTQQIAEAGPTLLPYLENRDLGLRLKLADDLPCVGCDEATVCFGSQTVVHDRLKPLFFYPFFMLSQPAPKLNLLEFLELIAGAGYEQVAQNLIRKNKPGRLRKFQQLKEPLSHGSGFLSDSRDHLFIEVVYLKLCLLDELTVLISRLGGEQTEPVKSNSLESVWVDLPEQSARLPLFWNFSLRLIDLVDLVKTVIISPAKPGDGDSDTENKVTPQSPVTEDELEKTVMVTPTRIFLLIKNNLSFSDSTEKGEQTIQQFIEFYLEGEDQTQSLEAYLRQISNAFLWKIISKSLKIIVKNSFARKEDCGMLHRILLILCVVFCFVACASQSLPEPQWSFEKDAIRINLKADSRLNFDDGIPHKLVLCIYQLKDASGFNQLSDDTQGVDTLLGCTLFDDSVATAKRLIVHPGQDMNVKLDRAESAKYLAVAAGYYVLSKDRMIRVYEIPVVVEKKGYFKRTKLTKPGVLDIELQLGPSQIHEK